MRKHPLIALTAFTALGTSVLAAGTTTGGPSNTLLTSSTSSFHLHSGHTRPGDYLKPSQTEKSATLLDLAVARHGARTLSAMHDPLLDTRVRTEISSKSGLVITPADRRRAAAARKKARAVLRAEQALAARAAAPKPVPVAIPAPAPVVPVTTTAPPVPVAVSAPPPVTAPPAPAAPSGGVWYELRVCESGDNYAENTGNGYYGAYQFALATWYGLGFSGLPSNASVAVQDQAAAELQARSGWGQWPQCAAKLGLL
jgi:hypothetical protein